MSCEDYLEDDYCKKIAEEGGDSSVRPWVKVSAIMGCLVLAVIAPFIAKKADQARCCYFDCICGKEEVEGDSVDNILNEMREEDKKLKEDMERKEREEEWKKKCGECKLT